MGFFPTLWFHRIYSNKLGLYINFLLYMSMTTNTCSNSCFFYSLGVPHALIFHSFVFLIPLFWNPPNQRSGNSNEFVLLHKQGSSVFFVTNIFLCVYFFFAIWYVCVSLIIWQIFKYIEIHNFLWLKTKLFYTYEGSDYAIKT
jgi:hypothetical protein